MTESKNEGGFGFRDLQAFNSALLASMAAHLFEDPSSLWAQVMKGLYFPSCNFMQASKGGRSSWGWSSLLHGRDVMQ